MRALVLILLLLLLPISFPYLIFLEFKGFNALLTYRHHIIKDLRTLSLFKENSKLDEFNHLAG